LNLLHGFHPVKDSNQQNENDFSRLIGGLKRLSDDKVNLLDQKPKTNLEPRPRNETSKQPSAHREISENFKQLAQERYFAAGLQKNLLRKFRQGQLAFGDSLDLHGFNQQQALAELIRFFEHCLQQKYQVVIVVHGKGNRSGGIAVIKPLVQHWLSEQSQILAFCPAQPRDGGSGASYVLLKSN